MQSKERELLRVAILDLYEGQPNEGMRCIRDILKQFSADHGLDLIYDVFDVRLKNQVPDLDHDIYLSSGGPGSPIDSEGSEWEKIYFNWLGKIQDYNDDPAKKRKKQALFICHSYQLACRYFEIGQVTKRRSTAFGVFPVHILANGKNEPVFEGLQDPFYAVDSRNFQVIEPDLAQLERLGGSILAIEKERPHIPLERAIMAVRFNEHMVGTQFHPEADATGMTMYLHREDKKNMVIEDHGFDKWQSMIEQLNDPDKIRWTYSHVIPNFLSGALAKACVEQA